MTTQKMLSGLRKGITTYKLIADGDKVRPIAVERSINDGAYSAIESPDIREGMEVVVGTETISGSSSSSSNPFMPKMPQRKRGNNNTTTKKK